MQLILLVAGLILVLVPTLFASAATIGWICLAVFAVITLIQLLILGVGFWAAGSQSKSITRRNRW